MDLTSVEKAAVTAARNQYYALSGAAKDEFLLGISWAEKHYSASVLIAFAIGMLFGIVVF